MVLCAVAVLALCVGRYPLHPQDVLHALLPLSDSTDGQARKGLLHAIVIDARLPRVLAAALIGAALSVSGAAYQAVFRNPLVSPGMLGVLSGSACGAALGIVLGLHPAWIPLCAFSLGVASVVLGVGIASMLQRGSILTLMLGGLISNALFTALLSLIKYTADPLNQLPTIVYWILGSLAQIAWTDIDRFAIPLLIGTVVLCLSGPILDTLSLSDDEARSLGVPVQPIRLAVIALATLLAALTVSLAGIIGWIGLLAPHLARPLVGASNSRLLPMSALIGAIILMLADTVARSVSAGEIPLGIVTELFGALAFVIVLRQFRGSMA